MGTDNGDNRATLTPKTKNGHNTRINKKYAKDSMTRQQQKQAHKPIHTQIYRKKEFLDDQLTCACNGGGGGGGERREKAIGVQQVFFPPTLKVARLWLFLSILSQSTTTILSVYYKRVVADFTCECVVCACFCLFVSVPSKNSRTGPVRAW